MLRNNLHLQKVLILSLQVIDLMGWQYLGRQRHVVLPSCVVAKIRQEFSSASEE